MSWEKIENGKLMRHEKDLEFTVVAKRDESYCVNFWILDYWGETPESELAWVKDTFPNNQHFTTSRAEFDTFVHGHVKYDGCSNWHFDIADGIMLHGCDKKDLQRIGDILARCWDWAREILDEEADES